jgi:molecular chaperone GrpE
LEENEKKESQPVDQEAGGTSPAAERPAGQGSEELNRTIEELNNKYLRLYAEFDNYRKRVNREREDLLKYGNESLLSELLPAIDHLELALKHAAGEVNSGLVQGVEMTLKELYRTLEKFGLTRIEAEGKYFDPSVHHAMAQVERDDIDEKMVAEEMRTGYRYRDKVLRPSLVAVSVKPPKKRGESGIEEQPAAAKENGENIEEEY